MRQRERSVAVGDPDLDGLPVISKRAIAEFNRKFREWSRSRGQAMPEELLTIAARERIAAREAEEQRDNADEDAAPRAPAPRRERGKARGVLRIAGDGSDVLVGRLGGARKGSL